MLTIIPNKSSIYPPKQINSTGGKYKNTLNADTCNFSNVSFQGHSLAQVKALITKKQIIDGKNVFVHVEDFIKNGKNSLLCRKLPILKDTFSFRTPLKDYTKEKYTVGDHTINVVNHLIHNNEEFKLLNRADQEILLVVALFHDVGKTEQIIKKSLLKSEDFENANFNGSDFDNVLKSKIDELKIFNPFSDYKQKLINYFNANKNLPEVLVHNNIHPTTSVKFLDKFLSDSPNNKEFSKIRYLITHHQDIGEQIDKYQYKYISKEEFESMPNKLAESITDLHDLNLIKIFHISDANGVPQLPEKLENFLSILEETSSSIESVIKQRNINKK